MTMVNNGINKVRDLVAVDVTDGILGEGTTASDPTDTGLETADATTEKDITVVSTDKQTKETYTLLSTEGSTKTYTEYITRAADTTTYDRIVFTGISFTTDGTEDLIIIKKRFFKSV